MDWALSALRSSFSYEAFSVAWDQPSFSPSQSKPCKLHGYTCALYFFLMLLVESCVFFCRAAQLDQEARDIKVG